MTRLVLAFASPRRRDLLSLLGIAFEVLPIEAVERVDAHPDPEIVARRLARVKAEAARLAEPEAAIIAADTIVVLDGDILGKPRDDSQARDMLQRLRARAHRVVTAVAVMPRGQRSALLRHPTTQVRLRSYTDGEIEASIAGGDPFDKAGAYAIQDEVFHPVQSYDGCYCNVVGLPLWTTVRLLRKARVDVGHLSAAGLLPQCARCPDHGVDV